MKKKLCGGRIMGHSGYMREHLEYPKVPDRRVKIFWCRQSAGKSHENATPQRLHVKQAMNWLGDIVWPRARVREVAEMTTRLAVALFAVGLLSNSSQFCDVKDASQQGLHKGDTFHWNIYSDIATQGATLTETTTMPESNFTITQGTLTIDEFGNSVLN